MSDDLERVMSRIRKMLALANDAGASEGERDNALRMAQATLAKHNLDMSSIGDGKAPDEARIKDAITTRSRPWIRRVAHGVATLFFCNYFSMRGKDGDQHYFVGKQSNVLTAKEMLPYLVQSLRKEAFKNPDNSYRTSFLQAAATTIYWRCVDLTEEPVQDAAPGTAVVLASYYRTEVAANDAFLKDLGVNLRTGKNRERDVGPAGRAEGAAFGKTVSLNKQIGGSSPMGRLT